MQKYLFSFILFLFSFFLIENQAFSQSKFKHVFSKAGSVDSLAGFDEEMYKAIALSEGAYGEAYTRFIVTQKRYYIDTKYKLKEYFEYPVDPNTEEYKQMLQNALNGAPVYGKQIGGGNAVNIAPCVNEGFELSNISGWTSARGVNFNSYNYPATPSPVTFPSSSLMIVQTPTTDPIIGSIANSPFPGNKVLKINDGTTYSPAGADLVKISQTFPVSSTNFLYEFAYQAVSLQSPHTCSQQPYMRVVLKDFVGNLLPCPNFTFASPNPTAVCSTTGITTWSLSGGVYRNPTWQKYSIDLTSYISSTVTIEVIVSDCSQQGHYMYAYFDSNCSQMGVTLNNSVTIPAPTSTVNVAGQCAQVATLSAPGGLGPYDWDGPLGSSVSNNTNQTISAPIAGDYTLSMWPPGTCLPIVRVIKMSFPPPTTITASPSTTICTSGTNTLATLSAVGAAQYTWQPGGSTSSSIAVSPIATTIYTVTARTGTCVGDYTFQVTVAPNPNLVVLASNFSLCPGQAATLTASGANTYSWLPVGLTGSLISVTQTANTTYTTVGTSTAGCVSTATTGIVQTVLLPIQIFHLFGPTGTICPGTTVNKIAINALTYTWYPVGYVGNPAPLTPSITTNYTVIGASGSCTNDGYVTVTVDPGPGMTVTSNPTLVCPGNNATLTSVSPSALSFTWAPVASNASFVVVTPTAPTVYSVSGTNSLGCISSYTVEPVIGPVPVLTISPVSPTVCFGSTVAVTASGGSTYTWNPGALTGSTAVVSPTSNTTYTIVGSNGTCTSSATSSVSVISLPPVTAGSTTTSICVGNTVMLSSGGASTYTWNPGGLTGANVTVSPLVSTNYTVTGLQGSCRNTATVGITVYSGSILNPVASPTAVCPGGSSTLSASGATSYTWNPGGLIGGTVNATPVGTTNYTVSAINVFGCTSTATRIVLVNPTPTLNITASSPSICIGSNVNYTVSGAANYTWNPGAITGSLVSFSPTANTIYTATGASTFGCIGQRTVAVSVVPLPTVVPVANPTVICRGSSASLSATGATSYTWNPGALSGSMVSVSPNINTTYTVIGRAAGCNASSTVSVAVLISPTLNPIATPTAVCPGGNVNLSASGALGYTWNPGNLNGASVNVNPTITTTYSITGVNSIPCLTTETVLVTVNPLPSLTITASSPSICAGSSVNYTASGASTYTWNPGAIVGSTISFTPSGSTSYTVSGTNGFGCVNQRSVAITVVPNPTPVASSTPVSICSGNSATLSGTGATTYTWLPGPLSGSLVSVSPTLSTTYTLTGRTAGCNGTTSVFVTVQNGPTLNPVASPTIVCPGGLSNLSSTGALSYTWNPGGLIGASVNVNPTVATTYSVTGINGFGCLTTRTLQVLVYPAPIVSVSASSSSICAGATVTLTAGGAGFYNWNPGALGGISVVVNPTVTTTYTVVGTNGFGCTDQKTITILVVPIPTIVPVASPNPICIGFSSTLSATGAASYTWNPGAITASTTVVSPTTNTTYTINGSVSTCTSISYITVSVQNNPTVNPVASPTAICFGLSATLSSGGAANYTWNPGGLTGASVSVSPAVSTVYTLTGASAIGCLTSATVGLTVNPLPSLTLTPSTSSICAGSTVSITASGAQSYTWLPGASTGSQVSFNPTITTTYSVTGSSSLGCVSQATTTVTVVPLPVLSAGSTPTAICFGSIATLTVSGATTYTWATGATGPTATISPLTSTSVAVFGTSNSCTSSTNVIVVVNYPTALSTIANPTAVCPGFSSILSANGASTYTWNPGNLTGANVTVTPLANTVYTVVGTNTAGCISNATTAVDVYPVPSITLSALNPAICSGNTTTLSAAGATSYTWNPGSLTGTSVAVNPSLTTTYSVLGSNAFGCISPQQTITLFVSPTPTVSASASPTAICVNNCSSLTANGASSYVWSLGSTGSTAVVCPTLASTQTIIVAGTTGSCSSSYTLFLPVNPLPNLTVTPSSTAICSGSSATLNAGGATTYTWFPGGTVGNSMVPSPSVNTVYTVVGTNANGCINSTTFTLVVNPTPTVNLSATNNTVCSGVSLTLTANGATSYTWNPGILTGSSVVQSPTMTTNYTVTGLLGTCSSTSSILITALPLPTVSAVANPTVVCAGLSTSLTAGGAASYTWMPMNITGSLVSATPTGTGSTYIVTGQSTLGCLNTATIAVNVNPLPNLTVTPSSTAICYGSSATLTANGATTYTWLPGSTVAGSIVVNPTLTSTYTLNGTNANGCINSTTFTLVVNPTPTVNLSATNNTVCSGVSLTLTANGATSYTWNPGILTGSSVVQSPTMTTNYTVTGLLGTCSSTSSILITALPLPTVSAAANPTVVCAGLSTSLTAGGAASYTWMPMNITGSLVSATPTGTGSTYTVTGQSTLGCLNTATIAVNVNPLPNLTVTPSSTAICYGSSATLTASGATTYTWLPGSTVAGSIVVNPTLTSTYTLNGTNANGCINSTTFTLIVNPTPTVNLSATNNTVCSGVSLTLTANGATSYTWNPGILTGSSVVQSPTMTTNYTVTGLLGTCSSTSSILITALPLPTVSAAANPTVVCAGLSTSLTAGGAASYTWMPMNITGSLVSATPTGTGSTYTVTGQSTLGCLNTATIAVNVNPLPNLTVTPSSTAICYGSSATLTANGATTYTWLPGSTVAGSIVVNPTLTSTYTLNGTNANGCINSTTFTLVVNPTPTVNLSATNNTVCSGVSLTLTANGATSYTWNPGILTGSSVVQSPTMTTNYTVTGLLGTCSSTSSILITALPLPTVSAAANPTVVCAGLSTSLTAGGAASYTWMPMNITGSLVSATPTGTGSTYTVTGQSTLGCLNTATIAVNVNPLPNLTVTPSSTAICYGSSATLTANGATTYTWLPGSTAAGSIVVNPTLTSTYTLNGTNANGCINSTTFTLIVNPLPVITPSISSPAVCLGNSVALSVSSSGSGPMSYTWNPINGSGTTASDTPSASQVYTVVGQDVNACVNSATVGVVVNSHPTLTAVASASAICEGATVGLSANGAVNYTWSPSNLNGASVVHSPSLSTTYTVFGEDANGCTDTETVAVQVILNPTVSISPQTSTICVGNSVTLTASGAPNYTWSPGGSTANSIVESPTVTTTYTLDGDNAGLCFHSFTAQIVVNPLPANVTASVSGIISCAGPTVDLFGASTDTNVAYFWTGPLSYSSSAQNPTAVGFWGDYTLTVTDHLTGCVTTVTVNVPTDYSIPSVSLSTTSSSITCAIPQVTLNAANTTTNPSFVWTGPGATGSNTTQIITATLQGVYSITITDLSSSCIGTGSISISTFTDVVITASIVPATCNGTVSNNDGTILAFNFGALDKFDLVSGATYTGNATYANATPIPNNGIVSNTLANPSNTVAYTIRFFDDKGCVKDTTLILTPTNCEINAFGLAKSVPSIVTNEDGTYEVTVKTVVKNYGTVPLTEVKLEENLNAVFASPMTYTVVNAPSIVSGTSALVMNSGFDGNVETSLTNTLGSQIGVGMTDTIQFTVRVTPFGRFGPFSNTIKGTANSSAVPSMTIVLADSSQNGIDPDPDLDENPENNNQPTTFNFTPKLFFGITKTGEALKSDNNSFDFKYVITVHNLGNDTLYNVNLKDSLYDNTVRLPATYNIRTQPTVSGNGQLSANVNYDGKNDVRLIDPVLSKMPPGTTGSITFVINVITDSVRVYKNSANGTAFNSKNTLVSDTSGNGTDPDLNNNGVWNEPADNLPTILAVYNPTFFIPQGFSPNGDGINDVLSIKGLPDGENELIIYNRWGNVVYENADYDNTWDGTANRGSGGNNKLPQGTYYYILKLKGTDQKPFTGFIVLQY